MRGVLLILLWVLSAAAQGELPTGGYCIGNMCFALFETIIDFEGAQNVCGQHMGNLMTVRSSVDHDTLSLLLGNTTGLHWIGLHLPKGCPDLSKELRGYEWVTTETRSDFYNWAEASPENLCQSQIDGFLCEYMFLDERCQGIQNTNVLYTTPYGFSVEDAVALPPGSVAEQPDENKQVCVSGQWIGAPWSCEIQHGGCEHRCTDDPENHPVCYCQPGFTVNSTNMLTCEPAIDDPCMKLNCAHACYKYSDSFLCTCHEGFVLENEKCINTEGWFKCVCKDGYQLNGGMCVDINECESAPCEHMCTNNAGGYDCSCYDGYKADPMSPDKCKLHCGKEECVAVCDPNNRYQCYCPDGYILEERVAHSVCIDIDECESDAHCDQDCENSFGGYECFCNPGFTLVDKTTCEIGGTIGVTEKVIVVTVAPTHRPSGVSAGGFVGIIICTVFLILLAVFFIHHILCGKGKTDSPEALKAPESPEAHSLHLVTTDTTT
uniref:Thrombomodulin n=1 Tax=Neogobius melanostomus TaxID=47308 RepID=A0A8C6X064_9GOBI